MQPQSLQSDALMDQYIHIVNDAIGRHEDETPYKQILSLSSDFEAGVALYKTDPDAPEDHFVLGWHEGRLRVVHHGKKGDHTWWSMPREHLEHVVDEPKPYLESPAKLNLDWMTERLGL